VRRARRDRDTRRDLEDAPATPDDREAAVIAYLVADAHSNRRLELAELQELDAKSSAERQGWIANGAWAASLFDGSTRAETLMSLPGSTNGPTACATRTPSSRGSRARRHPQVLTR
jgi:hypothetical protein